MVDPQTAPFQERAHQTLVVDSRDNVLHKEYQILFMSQMATMIHWLILIASRCTFTLFMREGMHVCMYVCMHAYIRFRTSKLRDVWLFDATPMNVSSSSPPSSSTDFLSFDLYIAYLTEWAQIECQLGFYFFPPDRLFTKKGRITKKTPGKFVCKLHF
jgi:hypothetical protein